MDKKEELTMEDLRDQIYVIIGTISSAVSAEENEKSIKELLEMIETYKAEAVEEAKADMMNTIKSTLFKTRKRFDKGFTETFLSALQTGIDEAEIDILEAINLIQSNNDGK